MIKIKKINNIYSQCTENINILSNLLFCTRETWSKNKYNYKKRNFYNYFFIKKNGLFYTGFIPRILKKYNDIYIYPNNSMYDNEPKIFECQNNEFRNYQINAINSAILNKRGIILSDTGSGKTKIAIGTIKSFPINYNILYITPKTLINQTKEIFTKEFNEDIGEYSSNKQDIKRITIGNIQFIYKNFIHFVNFDIVICDEAHHCCSKTYEYFLSRINAKIRLGLTATMPKDEYKSMLIEGLLGPIIHKTDSVILEKNKFLAKPKIIFKVVTKNPKYLDLRIYRDIYTECVINNKNRNLSIIKEAYDLSKQNKTSLIIVNKLDHGHNLIECSNKYFPDLKIFFVRGEIEKDVRENIRKILIDKKIHVCIATSVFKEGVDIPSLNAVINGAGGKSEIATIQGLGRGLRPTKDKDQVIFIDFLDPYKYLAEHAIQRLSLYVEKGWM